MGFHVEINSILRSDDKFDLKVDAICDFKKKGSRVFFDDIPIWLTESDWTALAEIRVVSQTRAPEGVSGTFRVLQVYSGTEQEVLTDVFRRMFSFPGEFDPFFYLLESQALLDAAKPFGVLVREDLREEGFIHASPANQLTRVANKYYRDVKDLVCAAVSKQRVLAMVKYEPATGGLYPHVYGPLNLDAVEAIAKIQARSDGSYDIDTKILFSALGK